MRKKLSFLIALAMSLSISTAVFADAVPAVSSSTTNASVNNDNSRLTLNEALNTVEKSNTELKLMNDKINSLNKQFDIDHNYATSTDIDNIVVQMENQIGVLKNTLNNAPNKNISSLLDSKFGLVTNKYLQVKMVQEVRPLSDVQQIKDAKNDRDDRLNVIKFDIQRQYMNVLTSRDQIDNINKNLSNIDEKIKIFEEKIKVGQAASNEIDPLNVQKTQLVAQKDDIQNGIDQSLLKIKQYLNIDLNKEINLSSEKKNFVKFDDSDITNKINDAIKKDYILSSIQGKIEIAQKAYDINVKYSRNDVSGENSYKSSLATAQNGLITAKAGLPQALWANYHLLKSKENAVETQILTEKSAQDAYAKAKKNFEVGTTDKLTVDSAALELDKQKNLTERSVNEYMIAQDEFKYMLEGHASGYKNMSTQSIGVSGIGY